MEGPLGNARSGRLLLCRGPVSAAFRGVPAASRKPRPAGPARVPRASGPRPGRVPRPWRVSAASRGVLAASRRVPELASPASQPRLKDRALPRALLHGAPVRQEPPARVRSEDAGRRRVKGPSGCYFQLDVGESSCCDRCERMGAPRSLKRPPRKKKMSDRSPGRQ